MQVNGVLGEHACVFENDWPNGRLAAPVGELLVLLAWRSEGVEGRGPARIGLRAAVEPRECPDWPSRVVSPFREPLGAKELKGTGQRVSERRWNLILDDGVVVKLPETDWQKELDALEHLIIDKGILERDVIEIDLRSPAQYFFVLKSGEKKDVQRDKET